MDSGIIKVPSVFGPALAVPVSGAHTLAYAERFADALDQALAAQTLAYENLSDPRASIPGYTAVPASVASALEFEISSPGTAALADRTSIAGAYTLVTSDGPTTIYGSGQSAGSEPFVQDNVLVEGVHSATSFFASGSAVVTFVDGDNAFVGNLPSFGDDTVAAGSGRDTIGAGANRALILAGTGHALIKLQDIARGLAPPDPGSVAVSDYTQFAILDSGQNTVLAGSAAERFSGAADVIVASAPGQVIIGGLGADTLYGLAQGHDLVALVPPSGAAGPAEGHDTLDANGAVFTLYDATQDNAVFGGTGVLTAVFAEGVRGSVTAGTGSNVVYGNAGDTIDYEGASSQSGGIVVLGAGPETLDAHLAASGLTIVLGTGNETLIGGANTGYNANFASVSATPGTITIQDFAGAGFNFVGYSDAHYAAALATGTQIAGGYQISLADDTKVIFAGVAGIGGQTSHTP